MLEQTSSSTYTIPCHDIVNVVEYCPFEWCSSLLAVGTNSRITIFRCRFEEELEGEEESMQEQFEFDTVCDIQNGCPVTALSWCPATSYRSYERVDLIRFAAAGSNRRIKVFKYDFREDSHAEILEGHTDFVNALCYNPENDDMLASTGDDQTCRLWSNDGTQQACFQLGTPGMSVCIHEKETGKVMVAQKNGIIKIFSLDLQQQICSYDCGVTPLMAVDWCHTDEDMVGAVAGTEWLVFQLSRSSQPLERRQAHTEGVRNIRWCKSNATLLATSGRPGRQVKVFSTRHHQVPLNTTLQVSYGMSWHCRLPVLAIGGDCKVHLFQIEPAKHDT